MDQTAFRSGRSPSHHPLLALAPSLGRFARLCLHVGLPSSPSITLRRWHAQRLLRLDQGPKHTSAFRMDAFPGIEFELNGFFSFVSSFARDITDPTPLRSGYSSSYDVLTRFYHGNFLVFLLVIWVVSAKFGAPSYLSFITTPTSSTSTTSGEPLFYYTPTEKEDGVQKERLSIWNFDS